MVRYRIFINLWWELSLYDASKCNKNKHIKLLPKHEKYSLQLRSSDQKAIDAAAAAASSLALSWNRSICIIL